MINLIKVPSSQLRVQTLSAKHLSMLALGQHSEKLRWLQLMLVRTWLAHIEKNLGNLVPAKQSCSLVVIEENNIIAISNLIPNNKKGTSWEITESDFYQGKIKATERQIFQKLFEAATEFENRRSYSWIIRSEASNVDRLAAARELGFQPLKTFRCWNPPEINKNEVKDYKLPVNLKWDSINQTNISLLWNLKKASESPHLRQIVDRTISDLMEQSRENSGILIKNSNQGKQAIFALISREGLYKSQNLELVRNTLWDNSMNKAIPMILSKLSLREWELTLEINKDDAILNQLLKEYGWRDVGEKILLGRSIWKRSTNKTIIKGAKSLGTIIEGFKPQSPPLPSPYIDYHGK